MTDIRKRAIVGLKAGDSFTLARTFTEDETLSFGDTITCVFTITEVDERNRARAEAILSNQHGESVIEAWLTAVLPGPREQEVLSALVSEQKTRPAS